MLKIFLTERRGCSSYELHPLLSVILVFYLVILERKFVAFTVDNDWMFAVNLL